MQIEGLSSPGDRTCILEILIPATVNFIRVYVHVLDQKIALQKIPPFLTRKVLDTDQR